MQFEEYDDVICCMNYNYTNNDNVETIVKNTANTWQDGRDESETMKDTTQGKIAEDIFEKYIKSELSDLGIISYDKIRNDNGLKHAPFDFLIWKGNKDISNIVLSIQYDISNSEEDRIVRLGKYTRELCKKNNIKIVEVKSTKILKKKKIDSNFDNNYSNKEKVKALIYEIQKDDYFTYPVFTRSVNDNNFSIEKYCNLARQKRAEWKELPYSSLLQNVIQNEIDENSMDINVRVYLDEKKKVGFLMGWIDKKELFNEVVLKRMPQKGKSEKAIYFTKSLKYGRDIKKIGEVFENKVYISKLDSALFCHKFRSCYFLRKTQNNNIITFDSIYQAERALKKERLPKCKCMYKEVKHGI